MADGDIAAAFGDEAAVQQRLRHPVATFFHLAFRSLALISYLFCNFVFHAGFTLTFIIVVMLLAADFWTVKNVSGRLMVGLRWWNKVNEDGSTEWVFESRKGGTEKHHLQSESNIFWIAMGTSTLFWGLLFIKNLLGFSLEWMVVCAVGIFLNSANLYGYVKCRKDAKAKVQGAVTGFLGKQMWNQAFGGGGEASTATR